MERFDAAFALLDDGSNVVSLADLRRKLALPRQEFDHLLARLRLSGRYAVAGPRQGQVLTPEDMAASVREVGALAVSVRRQATAR